MLPLEAAPTSTLLPLVSSTAIDLASPPHETELALGLVAGTWGVPQALEVSAPLLGGSLQLGNKLKVEDFNKRPLQIFVATLLAFLLMALWERL
jgi:hypothetical protein